MHEPRQSSFGFWTVIVLIFLIGVPSLYVASYGPTWWILERREGPPRFFLLDETENGIEEHDGNDRRGVGPLAEQPRHNRRDNQEPDDDVAELPQKLPPHRLGRGCFEFVGSVLFAPPGDLGRFESVPGIDLQPLQNVIRRLCKRTNPTEFRAGTM